jgi:hypothetical protein
LLAYPLSFSEEVIGTTIREMWEWLKL